MAIRSNPVRGQYLLVGTDLIRAGIRTVLGATQFVREGSGAVIASEDPRSERWLTSRAVTAAASQLGVKVDMGAVPFNAKFATLIKADPKAGFRLTADHIVHMAGGETKENRAYAEAQVEELELAYGISKTD